MVERGWSNEGGVRPPEPSNTPARQQRNVTRWIESPEGGRERGAVGLARAWVEVLVRPRRFFRNGVAPGDQAAGLAFAVAVAVTYLTARYLLDPGAVPELLGGRTVSAVLSVLVAALLVAPLVLHLIATLETLLLAGLAPDRAGVGETVQLVAYASAPGVFAAVPVPAVRVAAAVWGAGLLVVGTAVVHRASAPRAVVAGAVPAALVFGYGFGGFAALEQVTGVVVVPDAAPEDVPAPSGDAGDVS